MKKDLTVEISGIAPENVVVALKEELTISEDLEREVDRTAAEFGYYAVLSEKAKSKLNKVKMAYSLWKAKTEEMLIAENKGQFKNKDQLERLLTIQPQWKSWQLKIAEVSEQSGILKELASGFEKKVSLVQTKCSNRRAEAKMN